MSRRNRSLLIIMLLVTCVGCNQVTKDFAQHHLAAGTPISWFHDTIRLQYTENIGAFLSAGAGLPEEARTLLFQGAVGTFLAGLLLFIITMPSASGVWLVGWCLVLSGGVGNLLDRVLHNGQVIDFMNVGIGNLRTGIFNVADVCITTGVVLVLMEAYRQRSRLQRARS
jgi:signal peptidase II